VIVSEDSDFQAMTVLRGAPPKVIWLRSGNTSKAGVITLLMPSKDHILRALADASINCIELK
jgi:predicted nuclease of predicted toxin-antitoxin system